MWSDIFLASAGVVNFNNGNVTITHAAGKLTTNADLEFLRDANNADVKLTLGTSAAESLIIQVLNGGSNKTAEEIHFSTATASGTANHGKMVFDVDGTDIATIDDGGIDIGSGLTFSVNGTDVVSAAGAITGITSLLATDIKIGEDDETKIDFEDANTINFYANNAKEVVLAENSISPGTSDGTALGTTSLMWSDLFLADGGVINFNNGDVLLTHSSNLITLTGGGLVVGVDDTGHDVKFFGATSGKYMEWDESANQLDVTGSFDVTGNSSMVGTLTVGVDDTGHDVKFFGASAGAYMEWDESADQLRIMGASADATTSTGKLLLATSLTDINANDVIGKIEFQAPHEAGGTDAITVAAGIEAVAQGTFSASVNATDILFKTGHSEAATEKFRFTSQGEIGIGGTNYGTDGQVLTSGGAGAAPSWADAASPAGSFTATADGAISAGDLVGLGTDGKVKTLSSPTEQNDMCTNSIPDTDTDLVDLSSSDVRGLNAAYDPDNSKGVVIWREGSSTYDLLAAVITLNTTTGAITIGSEAILHNGSSSNYANYSMGSPCIEYDTTADRFLVFYALWHSSGSSYRSFEAIVVDIDGTSIVSGTAQVVQANTTGGWERQDGAEFMTGRGHMAICYARTSYTGDGGSVVTGTRGGYIDVLTLDNSDNSFTTASSTKVVSGYDQNPSIAWDSVNGRFYYIHLDGSDDFMGKVVEHDNSDDSLTAGSDALINGDPTTNLSYGVHYWASAGQMAILLSVGGSNDTSATPLGTYLQLFTVSGSGQTGTLSSNRTTIRTERQHHDATSIDVFEPTTGNLDNQLVVTFVDYDGNTSYLSSYNYVASGVTVSAVVDASTISTDHKYQMAPQIISNGKGISLLFIENADNSQLQYITPSLLNTISTDSGAHYTRWIGIANDAISDGATGTITSVGGVGTGQSSLTIGTMYSIGSDSELEARGSMYGAASYANVGIALTATTIYITGGFSNG